MRIIRTPSTWLAAFTALLVVAPAAQADVYSKDSQQQVDKTAPAGGKGTVHFSMAFARDKSPANWAVKEVSWFTIQPGDSIGLHKHDVNEDVYMIVSGSGTYNDNGKLVPVKAGDVTIARIGESHGLANTGTEPLVVADVIAAQH